MRQAGTEKHTTMRVAIMSPLLFKIRIIRKDVFLVAIISTPACIGLK